MTISNFSQSFTVNQVSFSNTTDCCLNILKDREEILFKTSSSKKNVNLSYVQSVDINSFDNLSIVDKSTAVPENQLYVTQFDQVLSDVISFKTENDLFLVTNVFTDAISTQEAKPLFYKHIPAESLLTGTSYVNFKVLDSSFNPISSSLFKVVNNIIYSNLKNSFDFRTGVSTLYYISYGIKLTSGRIEQYLEILNNKPAFRLAEFEDIDFDLAQLKPEAQAYTLNEVPFSYYEVTLPVGGKWSVRKTKQERIELTKLDNLGPSNPWFVSVRNGQFLKIGVNGIQKYRIAEFLGQSFNPYLPYKQITDDCIRINENTIKLSRSQVSSDFPISITVKDKDGVELYTVSSEDDSFGSSKIQGVDVVGSSIDSLNGIIVMPVGKRIKETDILFPPSFTYKETNYEITDFNFNPLSNDLLNKKVVFLIRPEQLGSNLTKTLFYLIVDEDGQVSESNIDFTLVGLGSSVATLITDKKLFYNRTLPSWAPSGSKDIFKECTLIGSSNQDDLFVIGEVSVKEKVSPESLILNDIRVPAFQHSLTDSVGNGLPIPGMGSFLVEVPMSVVSDPNDIKTIVSRHMAAGTYPVIHGYTNYVSSITDIDNIGSDVYQVSWTEGPADSVYDLWEAKEEEFTLVVSGLNTTTYSAEALNNKTLLIIGRPSDEDTGYLNGTIFDIKRFKV